MANKNGENDGCLGVAGLAVIAMVIGLLAMIPKGVWIGLGVLAGIAVLGWCGKFVYEGVGRRSAVRAAQDAKECAAADAAEKIRRKAVLGEGNALCVDSAVVAVQQIGASQAAKDGWLGDIDFTADLQSIEAGFERAQQLRSVAEELRALPNPAPDDLALLTEAVVAADELDRVGRGRVDLIKRCVQEARLVDESLREEAQRLQAEEHREQLQRTLSAMLHGAEAATTASAETGVAGQVLARVAGYREIKQQVSRGGE